MRIRAFQGLCPPPDQAPLVSSLPYDVVTTDEARELAGDNPLSMLHVVRAEIDLPEGTDPYSDAVYARAVENFRRLQQHGHLVRERGRCVYVYRQQMGAHVQHGVVALCHVDDYDAGLIKKHERTRPDKENDRTRLTSELSANPGPVFLTYRDHAPVSELVTNVAATPSLFDFTAPDGIRHTGWRAGATRLVSAFASVPSVYVADGHHRAASAARVARERAAANPAHTGEEDYNWFLCVLFPAGELQILPYNRLVHDLNGMTGKELIVRAAAIEKGTTGESSTVRMYINGQWYDMALHSTATDAVSRLPVQMLQERVLAPLLGIDDPRTSDRITFVGGIRDDAYLARQVDAGQAAVAFKLPPVTVSQLMEIADAGQIMPPKSTWFEPKLRSGLFVHTF